MLRAINVLLIFNGIAPICFAAIGKHVKGNNIQFETDGRISKPRDMTTLVNQIADDWVTNTFQSMMGDISAFNTSITSTPTVSRNHYSVGEHLKVQKYCVRTKDENACMEVGYMDKPIKEYPIRLRVRRDTNMDYENEDAPQDEVDLADTDYDTFESSRNENEKDLTKESNQEKPSKVIRKPENSSPSKSKAGPPKRLPNRGGKKRYGKYPENSEYPNDDNNNNDDIGSSIKRKRPNVKKYPKRGEKKYPRKNSPRKMVNDNEDNSEPSMDEYDGNNDEYNQGNNNAKTKPRQGGLQNPDRDSETNRGNLDEDDTEQLGNNDDAYYDGNGQDSDSGSYIDQTTRSNIVQEYEYDDGKNDGKDESYEYDNSFEGGLDKKSGKGRKPIPNVSGKGMEGKTDIRESSTQDDSENGIKNSNPDKSGGKNKESIGVNDLDEKDGLKGGNRVEEDGEGNGNPVSHDWNHCKLPSPRNTFEALCKMLPGEVRCNLYCIFGHTFPDGIMRKTNCSYSTGVWTKRFEECKPFADCTLKLTTAGSLKCKTNTVKENTKCTISCERYDAYDSVTEKEYSCESSGRWKPNLPHCVTREGIETVEPPEVLEHKEIKYP